MSTPITDEDLKEIHDLHNVGVRLCSAEVGILLQALRERDAIIARLTRMVTDLEQRADPAGDVRRSVVAEEKAMALEVRVGELELMVEERDFTIGGVRAQLAELRTSFAKEAMRVVELELQLAELRKPVDEATLNSLSRFLCDLSYYNTLLTAVQSAKLRDCARLVHKYDTLARETAAYAKAHIVLTAERDAARHRCKELQELCDGETRKADRLQLDLDSAREEMRGLRERLESTGKQLTSAEHLASTLRTQLASETQQAGNILACHQERERQLRTLFMNFRDHVIANAVTWANGAGSHHHPIWMEVADALATQQPSGSKPQGEQKQMTTGEFLDFISSKENSNG